MIDVRMAEHNRIYAFRAETEAPVQRITCRSFPLEHAAIKQHPPSIGQFNQVLAAGDHSGGPMESDGGHERGV